MTLKELQKMIKEEFDAYMGEAEDDVDVSVNPDADVDAEMGDEEGGEGAEEMLRNIYDMLKAKFEMEDEMGDEEGDDDIEDVEEAGMDEEADLEELANHGVGKSASKSSGANVGYTPAKTTKGDGKLHENVQRFQKLANIIK